MDKFTIEELNESKELFTNIIKKANRYDKLLKFTGKAEFVCSFCGKTELANVRIIAGPGVCICSECIKLCNEIIEEELKNEAKEGE